jgi:hypothetical protein
MFTSILNVLSAVQLEQNRYLTSAIESANSSLGADVETIMLEEEEKDMRINNPAVKDAWDQYQMVLRLSRKKN